MEVFIEEKTEKKFVELNTTQNKFLHIIFSMTETQAKIALSMIMFGADFDYSLAASLRLCPEN
jgi:hypothetical protein